MKRIVFTVTNDLNYDQRMQRICSALAADGHIVELVGRHRKSSKVLKNQPFKQTRLNCFFDKGKLFYLEYNLRLFFYLLFVKADVFCAIDLDTILPNLFAGKLRRKKLVYDAHEYFTQVPEVVHRKKVQAAWKKIEAFSIPKMDVCYTVGPSLARIFSHQYRKPFEVFMNVPLLQKEVVPFEKKRFILYQGALNVGRGLEQLIDAMPQLPLQLYIAGEGDLSKELRERAERLGIGNKVKFLGFVDPAELKDLTKRAFAGYNLLENMGKSYYYSLSNKFFDYMHAAVPSLSPPFPEYSHINGQYEVALLTNLSTENIVLSVNKLLQDEGFYRTLQQNCLEAKAVYNWQNEEQRLKKLYHDL